MEGCAYHAHCREGRHVQVLVVDDLADSRVLLKRHLVSRGFVVTEATQETPVTLDPDSSQGSA